MPKAKILPDDKTIDIDEENEFILAENIWKERYGK